MKKFLLLIFLTACSQSNFNEINKFDFTQDLSFNEFITLLDEYAKIKPYPNID
tara:strand:+ start:32 stop:190 length:159 start_codon:yes stop_codon:yes gene_type:complete